MNLTDITREKGLDSEEKCIAYLETVRWPAGVCCPSCGSKKISRFLTKGKTGKLRHLFQCLDKTCRYQFSTTTGTIFHDSHLPLKKWFAAIALVSQSEEGISANQLRRSLGIQYKTAAHLARRIQEAIERSTIEVEEAQVREQSERGGKRRPVEIQPFSGLAQRRIGTKTQMVPSPDRKVLVGPFKEHVAPSAAASNPLSKETVRGEVPTTTFDNMLRMFVSLAQITFQPPLSFVNYIRTKVIT